MTTDSARLLAAKGQARRAASRHPNKGIPMLSNYENRIIVHSLKREELLIRNLIGRVDAIAVPELQKEHELILNLIKKINGRIAK